MAMREANFEELEEWQKHIILIFDKMHIKEDLVYEKTTGELKGFINLGDINKYLIQFEEASSTEKHVPTLANSMLTFMVSHPVVLPICAFSMQEYHRGLVVSPCMGSSTTP